VARALELREGARVVCPKCGREGGVAVDAFRAKGKEYKYWVVRHGTKRCILKRFEEPRKAQPPALSLPQEREEKRAEEARPVETFPRELQRRAWYIVKISSSVGALKENPSAENLQRLKNTAAQVEERLGVAVGELLEAAERFLESKSDVAKMRLNEAATLVACRILSSLPVEEKREKGREVAAPLVAATASLEQRVSALEGKLDSFAASVKELSSLKEGLNALAEKLNVEQLAEEIAKRIPLTAIPRSKVKGLRKMILEILSDGRERKSIEVQRELEKRFGASVSESSVAGRLSELAREGLVVKEKKGKEWYWRARSG